MDEPEFKMYPEPIGIVMTGVKVLEPDIWTVRRVPGKRTWLNWFPKDQVVIEGKYFIMTGDYEENVRAAYQSGNKLRFIR